MSFLKQPVLSNKLRTKQSYRDGSNINSIMDKYIDTGVLGNPINRDGRQPFFGDFSQFPDLRRALDITRAAGEIWDRLPAKLRMRFQNDPEMLIDFVNNEKNRTEAIELGIVAPPTGPEKIDVLIEKIDALIKNPGEQPVKKPE